MKSAICVTENGCIQMLKEQNIRCSVVGLAASVHVCQKLCRETQGAIFAPVVTYCPISFAQCMLDL